MMFNGLSKEETIMRAGSMLAQWRDKEKKNMTIWSVACVLHAGEEGIFDYLDSKRCSGFGQDQFLRAMCLTWCGRLSIYIMM